MKVIPQLLCLIQIVATVPLGKWQRTLMCAKLPTSVLENVLGAAFNPRYMSVDKPLVDNQGAASSKRGAAPIDEDFFVDDHFLEQVDDEPAWNISNHVSVAKKKFRLNRRRRDANLSKQWHCESKIEWIDLGSDYFPRYIRSVVCLSKNCWFNLYKCAPRSFTVKLLRRKRGFCAQNEDGANKVGFIGLPQDLVELWVWEERAVNFCCDCRQV